MATFIRVNITNTEQLINVEKIQRVRPIGEEKTRIYLDPFSDSVSSALIYFVDVNEPYSDVVKK
ncbi:hypothetical protein GO755_33590 [Spirosoma sp. HMF4905]|uniref:Uncharacterized protein n=1 Tax=Spirosoma arboris TaxID=2682092 RepID=A0A7K1SMI3_9BACT|nr:hypothetical protein [Spirosoma arboris]MVM35009.1 hypothetical protein [Spirosoma arboris]